MTMRRFCTALVLVAFIVALAPTPAAALPMLRECSEIQRPQVRLFAQFQIWLSTIWGQDLSQFIATEGASISTGG